MNYLVRRGFKSNGRHYPVGSVVTDPSEIRLFKTKVKERKLVAIEDATGQPEETTVVEEPVVEEPVVEEPVVEEPVVEEPVVEEPVVEEPVVEEPVVEELVQVKPKAAKAVVMK